MHLELDGLDCPNIFNGKRTCDPITKTKVKDTIKKMGKGEAVGHDEIPVEVWCCLGDARIRWLTRLFNTIIRTAKMPKEWRLSTIQLSHYTRIKEIYIVGVTTGRKAVYGRAAGIQAKPEFRANLDNNFYKKFINGQAKFDPYKFLGRHGNDYEAHG